MGDLRSSVIRFIYNGTHFGWNFAYKFRINKRNKEKRNELIQHALSKFFHSEIQTFKASDYMSDMEPVKKGYVWFFWWQASKKEDLPPVVQLCYENLIHNMAPLEVVFLNQDNVADFVDIPDFILDKLNRKEFSLTHFSDILRFSLLNRYGGIWCDATVLITEPIEKHMEVLQYRLFTQCFYKNKNEVLIADDARINVAFGRWTGFFQATNVIHHPLYALGEKLFYYYWSKNTQLLDYFLIDHIISLIYDNILEVKKDIDAIPINNKRIFYFVHDHEHVSLDNTYVFKLSWKDSVNIKEIQQKIKKDNVT